mmetsp:Transcript_50193/g.83393  ORF Transcript_50193/g.83393 Transcript_50193/m.83393 type:complete len:639 (-) Transcript_50193:220-2136(-)
MVPRQVQVGSLSPGLDTSSPSQPSRPPGFRKSPAELLGLRPAVPAPAAAEPPDRYKSLPSPVSFVGLEEQADLAITPFGAGSVSEFRPSKGIAVLEFPWGRGYLSRSCVKRSHVFVLESRLRTLASVFAVLVQPCSYLLEPAADVCAGIQVSYPADEKSWNRAAECLLLWLKQVVATPELYHRETLQEVEKVLNQIMNVRAQLGSDYCGGVGEDAEMVVEAVRDHLEAIASLECAAEEAAIPRRDARVLELEQSQEFGDLRALLEALDADLLSCNVPAGANTKKLCRSIDDSSGSLCDKQLSLGSPLPTTSRLVAVPPAASAMPLQQSWSSRTPAQRPSDISSPGRHNSPRPCHLLPGELIWPGASPGSESCVRQASASLHGPPPPCNVMLVQSGSSSTTVVLESTQRSLLSGSLQEEDSFVCRTPCARAPSPARTMSPLNTAAVWSTGHASCHSVGSRADELFSPPLQQRQCSETGSFVVRCASPAHSPLRQSPLRSGGGCQTPSRSGTPARTSRSHVLCPAACSSPACSPYSPGRGVISTPGGGSCGAASAGGGVVAVTSSRPGTPARAARASVHQGSPAGTRITMSPARVAPMGVGPVAAVVAQVRPSTPAPVAVVLGSTPVIMAQPVYSGGGGH